MAKEESPDVARCAICAKPIAPSEDQYKYTRCKEGCLFEGRPVHLTCGTTNHPKTLVREGRTLRELVYGE